MPSTLEAAQDLLATLAAGRFAVQKLAADHLSFSQLRAVTAASGDESALVTEVHRSLDRRLEVLRGRLTHSPVERTEDDRTPREAATVPTEEARTPAPPSRVQRAMNRAESLGPKPEAAPRPQPERRGLANARTLAPVEEEFAAPVAEAPAVQEAPASVAPPTPFVEEFDEPRLLSPAEAVAPSPEPEEIPTMQVESASALAPVEEAFTAPVETSPLIVATEAAPEINPVATLATPDAVDAPVIQLALPEPVVEPTVTEAPQAASAPEVSAPEVAPVPPQPEAVLASEPIPEPEFTPPPVAFSAPVGGPSPRVVAAVAAAAGAADDEDEDLDPEEPESGVAAINLRAVAPAAVRVGGPPAADDTLAGTDDDAEVETMGVGVAALGGGIKLRGPAAAKRREAETGGGPRLTEDEPSEVTQAPAAPSIRPAGDDGRIAQLLDDALVAAGKGDLHRAIQSFTDVLDLRHDRQDAYIGRGRCYLELGDYSSAMSDFQRAEDLQPDRPEAHVAMGDLYFARKEYRRAIEFYDQAVELDGSHAMARCRRGISHYYRKNYRQAFQDLQRAYSLDPEIPNIRKYVQMAVKKMERGD